ncbi:hypothetical protein BC834DRAFT_890096 [Gloeopeniophorella convolvens]|nr:hypothetical protein BC834DRAFT_890096 [Gloeopeniophorella convolvens]
MPWHCHYPHIPVRIEGLMDAPPAKLSRESAESRWLSLTRLQDHHWLGMREASSTVDLSKVASTYAFRANEPELHAPTLQGDVAASPISKLTSDILTLVFDLCKRDFIGSVQDGALMRELPNNSSIEDLPPAPAPITLGWIACSHVCRHWRGIILSSPSLWRDIVVDLGPLWLKQSFIRSKPVPRVRLLGRLSSMYSNPDIAIPATIGFSRVSALSLTSLTEDLVVSFLKSFRPGSASALTNAELTISLPSTRFEGSRPVPLSLLSCDSQSIQHMSLHNVFVAWEPFPFSARHLTHLEITVDRSNFMTKSPLSRVEKAVEFLGSTPALEVLSLIWCFQFRRDAIQPSDQTVELPRLRKLTLDDRTPECIYLLNHIAFPATSRAQIRFRFSEIEEEDIISVIRRTFRFFLHEESRAVGAATGTIGLFQSLKTGLHVLAHSSPHEAFPLEVPMSPPDADTDVNLCFKVWRGAPVNAYREAINALPEAFVDTLLIQEASPTLWHHLIERFPRVRHVVCPDGSTAVALCHAILPRQDGTVPAPGLGVLTLCSINIPRSNLESALLSALRSRRLFGQPLHRLILRKCVSRVEWLVEVRDNVEHVETV